MKRHNLLIFIEDVNNCSQILQYGLNLAKALDHQAVLVDVERLPTDLGQGPAAKVGFAGTEGMVMEEVERVTRDQMKDLREEARKVWPYTIIDVEVGFPVSEIERISNDVDSSMVLIQRRRSAGPFEKWFGSLSTDFVQALDCPVLVLPTDQKWKSPGRIAFLMDEENTSATLEPMQKYFDVFGSEILLLLDSESTVPEKDPVFLQKLKEIKMLFPPSKVKYKTLTESNARELQDIMRDELADWIVLQRKDFSFWDRITGNDLVREMVLVADAPVLVL